MFKIFCVLFIFSPMCLAQELVIWNVGQGQWVSDIHPDICIHYDLGGEKNLVSKVSKVCHSKLNVLLISHWDWDHISWAPRFAAKNRATCLYQLPIGETKSWKKDFLSKIPICSPENRQKLQLYAKTIFVPDPKAKKRIRPNDLSHVFESRPFRVLVPGDSTSVQERLWSHKLSPNIRGLILGHHGSKTSTSKILLENLPNLKWAVASSRQKKYGHPHFLVLKILKRFKVPLLRTEDWGHLHFRR